MSPIQRLRSGLVLLAVVWAGCSSSGSNETSGACTPGQQVACACPGAGQGVQVCRADGTGLGACVCSDAGTNVSKDGGNTSAKDGGSADAALDASQAQVIAADAGSALDGPENSGIPDAGARGSADGALDAAENPDVDEGPGGGSPCGDWGFPVSGYRRRDGCLEWGGANSDFPGDKHVADDFCAPKDTDVVAVADGIVAYASEYKTCPNWGYLILIDHSLKTGAHVCSLYGHVKPRAGVTVGGRVAGGEAIGDIAHLTCPKWADHIHLGIYDGPCSDIPCGTSTCYAHGYLSADVFPGKYVDPYNFLTARCPALATTVPDGGADRPESPVPDASVDRPEPTTPCTGLVSGDYCGANSQLRGYTGGPNDLVTCKQDKVASAVPCPGACQIKPPGQSDVCAVDPCAGKTCTTPTGQCYSSSGVCKDGACSYPYKSSSESCDDGDPCSVRDHCNGSGTCVAGCVPNWSCGDWLCSGGTATRTCTDTKGCGTTACAPSQSQPCPTRIPVHRRMWGKGECSTPGADWDHCPTLNDKDCLAGATAGNTYLPENPVNKEEFWIYPVSIAPGAPDTFLLNGTLLNRLDACYHAGVTRHLLEPQDKLKTDGQEDANSNGIGGWTCEKVGYVRTGPQQPPGQIGVYRMKDEKKTDTMYSTTEEATGCGFSGGVGWWAWGGP